MIFVTIIAGIGTIEGRILGTILFFVRQQTLSSYETWYLIILGLMAIVIAIWARCGLWGSIADRVHVRLFPVGYWLWPDDVAPRRRACGPGPPGPRSYQPRASMRLTDVKLPDEPDQHFDAATGLSVETVPWTVRIPADGRFKIAVAGGSDRGRVKGSRPRERAADNQPLNLVRSLDDLQHLGLAHIALRGVVRHVARAAEHLYGVGGHAHRHIGRE